MRLAIRAAVIDKIAGVDDVAGSAQFPHYCARSARGLPHRARDPLDPQQRPHRFSWRLIAIVFPITERMALGRRHGAPHSAPAASATNMAITIVATDANTNAIQMRARMFDSAEETVMMPMRALSAL